MSRDRAGPSQRQLRVGERIRHILAEELARGALRDPALEGVSVTVSEVRASPDLKQATAFVSVLGGMIEVETLRALSRAAPMLAGKVGRGANLKYAPKLRFVADSLFDEASRMDQLIRAEVDKMPASEEPPTSNEEADRGEP